MPKTLSPTRNLSEPAVDVLVVAADGPARARLAGQVWEALPSAQVHELAQLTDLVYRVAGSDVDLVVLAEDPQQPLPLTPMLVQMLKGIRPALRIVCVARAEPASKPPTDANLTDANLGDWLRGMYGGGRAAFADNAPPTRRP